MRDAVALEGRDDAFVAEHLRHPAAEPDDARAGIQKLIRRAGVKAGSEVRLRLPHMLLGFQAEVGERVGGILSIQGPAADHCVEADGKPRKVPGGIGVSHIDDLRKVQPEGFQELEGLAQADLAGLDVTLEERKENLIDPAQGKRGCIGFNLHEHEKEPHGLESLVESRGRLIGELLADPGDLPELRPPGRLVLISLGGEPPRLVRISAEKHRSAIKADEHGGTQVLPGALPRGFLHFFPKAADAQGKPGAQVGQDMPLRVVGLVDLHDPRDG